MSLTDERSAVARALTKKDLDEQIVQVAAELLGTEAGPGDGSPLPISAADYVRRMRRFIVYN